VALIPDTGPLLAALDAADPDHARCAALLTESVEDLVVPALVLADPAPAKPARRDPRRNVRGGSRRSRLVAVPVKVSTLQRTFCHRARIIYRVG
jgi:hypothetical protein